MAIGDVYRCVLVTRNATQEGITTHYFIVLTSSAPGILQADVAKGIDSTLNAAMKALMYNGATYDGASAQKVVPPLGLLPSIWAASAGPGTAGATALPTQTAGVITWQSVFAGRGNRGRSYIPFPASADDTGDGTPTAGYVTRLLAYKTALLAGFTVTDGLATETLGPIVWHKKTGLPGPTIFSARANARWGTQRRRGGYGRVNVPPF
jgi:hypothetical protein